jgi:DNA mismatch repair protein MLH1
MLSEYFSLDLTSAGEVQAIPLLLQGYTPNLDKLPYFLMRLGPQVRSHFSLLTTSVFTSYQVDWTSEIECFESFMRELAYFYAPGPGPFTGSEDSLHSSDPAVHEQTVGAERWQIQHIMFPAFRRYLTAPKALLDDGAAVQVANLPDLYKVFERC